MKLVHAADLHVDSPMTGLSLTDIAPVEAFRTATRRAVENLVALCLDESADLLLIAGDVYDGTWRDLNTGVFFARQMVRLAEAGTRVVMVSGNHDAATVVRDKVKLPNFVQVLDHTKPQTVRFEHLGVAIHGQSYGRRDVTRNLAEGYPFADRDAFNVGLLHTSAAGANVGDHEPYAPCTQGDLAAKGYHYWALGHVHERQVLGENPWIVYPGNTQGRSVRETGSRGCSVVTVDDGRVVSHEFRPLDVVRWGHVRIDVSAAKNRDDVVEAAAPFMADEAQAADGRPLALRVTLEGECALHDSLLDGTAQLRADLEAALPYGVYLEELKLRTTRTTSLADRTGFWKVLEAEIAAATSSDAPHVGDAISALVKMLRQHPDAGPGPEFQAAAVARAAAILRARLGGAR